MNIGFVGAPCSGKTTTAALGFAQLKEDGVVAEFVAERARYYIAKKKFLSFLHPFPNGEPLRLTDEDQYQIMEEQCEMQAILHYSVGKSGVVISDASALGALSYMTEAGRNTPEASRWIQRANHDTDLLFFAHPFEGYDQFDPNRIHDAAQARAIHHEIPDLLLRFSPGVPVIELRGDSFARKQEVLRAIYDRLPV